MSLLQLKLQRKLSLDQLTELRILLYDCIRTSPTKQIEILLATYFYHWISFTNQPSSSDYIILSTTTTGQGLSNENFWLCYIFNDIWGTTSTNENRTFILKCYTYLLQNSHIFIKQRLYWTKLIKWDLFLFHFMKHNLLWSDHT